MLLQLTDAETDYIYRLLMTRPMGEVESLVASMRRQIQAQANPQPTALPNGSATQEAIQ